MDSVIGGADDAEVLARARRIGFAGVEVTTTRDELRALSEARLDTLRRAKHASGLAIHALVLGGHIHDGGIADPSPHTAGRAREDVRAAIVWARELGADVVLVPFFIRS
jgi:sugar phosphate isomerase/epimerase